MNIIYFDINDLKAGLSTANSAIQASRINGEIEHGRRIAAEISRQSAKRDATLIAGAEASIEQKEFFQQQLDILREQNVLLCDNYDKLKEMYNAQVRENEDAKEELKRSRRYNAWMMVISVISMIAAILSIVIPFLCERLK